MKALNGGGNQAMPQTIDGDDVGSRSGIMKVSTFGDVTPALVHDLKGPLSAITMNLDFALDQLPDDPAHECVRSALVDCRQAGGRLFRMIANLLDVSRSEEGLLRARLGPVSAPAMLQTIADGYAIEVAMRRVDLQVKVDAKVDAGRVSLESDADLLGRVVQSLVENALRYTRPGGTILLSTRALELDGQTGTCEIRVSNDGPPVLANVREQLFQRNVPADAHQGGNRGLGLYFCKLAVDALRGTIALEETPGFNVSFVIRLPL
jgi:signal transduction histidine kinase